MKRYLILLPIFFCAFLQGAFLPLNLVLLLVLVWVAISRSQEGIVISFFSGLLLDLVQGTTLGLSSLIFLSTSLLLILYRRRLDLFHRYFWPVFIFLATAGYDLLVYSHFRWQQGLILAILASGVKWFLDRFIPQLNSQMVKLKL